MSEGSGSWGSQLRKGVLELAVLGLLAEEPRYGSSLVDDLAGRPGLAITAGTVYPLLARLAKAGSVTTTWRESRWVRHASTTRSPTAAVAGWT